MNLNSIWMSVLGTTELHGLNIGFWVSMAIVAVVVLVQNIVFWRMKLKK